MNNEQLKDILLTQYEQISEPEKLVERELLNKIKEFEKTPFIIIISGVRRCGKSSLLKQIWSEDSYFVNFDDERFIDFTVSDFQKLYEVLVELFGEKDTFCFDEIQNIQGWERFVRRLHDQKKKIYVTGSNSSMLSRELGTHLTGRNISLELYPFSFKEFLKLGDREVDKIDRLTPIDKSIIKGLFGEYFEKGGFPEYLLTEKDEYLINLYENVLYRDIITRYDLRAEKALKVTSQFAASNLGKELSFNSLKNMTGLTSATTIKEYFQYLANSYLVFLISRFSPSLKKQIYYNKKAYFIDLKLANLVGFRSSEDEGRMLENIVFLQLKRKNEDIFFNKNKKECDFVLRKGTRITTAIQVTWRLDKENEKMEMDGLLEAMNDYNLRTGFILTYDQEEKLKNKRKIINILPVWKWLLL